MIVTANGFPDMAGMAYGPEFFPLLIGAGLCLCALALIVSGARQTFAGRLPPALTPPHWFADPAARRRAAAVPAAVVFFILAAPTLGLLLTALIVFAALFALLRARPLPALLLALALPLLIHYVFAVTLRVPLPRGVLERWLF